MAVNLQIQDFQDIEGAANLSRKLNKKLMFWMGECQCHPPSIEKETQSRSVEYIRL